MSQEEVTTLKARIKDHQSKLRAAEAKVRKGHRGAEGKVEYHVAQIAQLEDVLLKLAGGKKKDVE